MGLFTVGKLPSITICFGSAEQVLHAQAAQSLGHELVAAAVEGRIDDFELVRHLAHHGGVYAHLHDLAEEGLVRLGAYHR